jgi:CDP-glucose 4,6-dehydratase
VRDYFYVRDAASAYLKLAEKLPEEPFVGQAFNFSTGVPVSVLELVQAILEVMGKTHLAPQVLNGATHEILHQTLDCSKAREMLGWQSEYNLEDGLSETIDWYRKWLERASHQASALASRYSQAR